MPTLPEAPPDLVVARAAILRGGRLLLVRRAAWDTLPGAWELPGGKARADEPPESAVRRELGEETGLSAAGALAAWFGLTVRSPSGRRVREQVYRVRAGGAPVLSDEHDDFIWHDPCTPLPAPLAQTAAAALRRL
jgi:8-oxo-dGTP pyrophosphatase MutT (NUDIX family)